MAAEVLMCRYETTHALSGSSKDSKERLAADCICVYSRKDADPD